jgi:hypothetical protein
MDIAVDVWVRGENDATTARIEGVNREPEAWTDGDIGTVLTGMLRALDRARNPDADPDRPMALRGFSWIVNPFEAGGVVIAMEMTVGAVVAGPFVIAERTLTDMIQRVVDADRTAMAVSLPASTIH